jgi:hypothetical protein
MGHPKSPKSMCIGSDSSNIFPKTMGRPLITTKETGQEVYARVFDAFEQNLYP